MCNSAGYVGAGWAVITSRPVLAAVKPPFTNHPTDKVHNLILPMALKEEQNQFQKASSVSPAIKSILLMNELQDESIFHVHNASSEQRSQSTSSFISGTLCQSCQLDKDHQTCCSQKAEGKGIDALQEYSLLGGKKWRMFSSSAHHDTADLCWPP